MKKYATVLTIAGSDCSGGAGIQADLKTFSALGCYGMSVITALTAQNTQGVQKIHPIPAAFVVAQLKSIFSDIEVKAIKIGMLFSEEIIRAVKKCLHNQYLQNRQDIPLVLDPVMIAKGGSLLLEENASRALRELFPYAALLTPNINEAEFILKQSIPDRVSMQEAAQELTQLGTKAVLIKGGHLDDAESDDCLYIKLEEEFSWFKAHRIVTENTHGTGCTLSAAIAAFLAQGYELSPAVSMAKKYITEVITAGKDYKLGAGHGPVKHFR